MSEETRTVLLPSGRSAQLRKAKVRDLLQAHRSVGFSGEPMAIAMGLIAEVATIDGKALIFEDVLEMPAEDGLVLQAAVLEEERTGNFREAPGSDAQGFSARE
jgi:hypothetical protein